MRALILTLTMIMAGAIFAQTDTSMAVEIESVDIPTTSNKDIVAVEIDDSTIKNEELKSIYLYTTVLNGDSVNVYVLPEFKKYGSKSAEEKRKYAKLIRDVKKVMPYAKLSAFRLQLLEDNLNLLTTKRAKKKYVKEVEKEIKKEFTAELKNLTVTQGNILLKLLHRETGKTSYEILRNFRGSASTFFWGTMAKIYHGNIKASYDPLGADREIEGIIKVYKLD